MYKETAGTMAYNKIETGRGTTLELREVPDGEVEMEWDGECYVLSFDELKALWGGMGHFMRTYSGTCVREYKR